MRCRRASENMWQLVDTAMHCLDECGTGGPRAYSWTPWTVSITTFRVNAGASISMNVYT
jgi:hypothetical protein